jgi:AP-2 complex subunit beta-1
MAAAMMMFMPLPPVDSLRSQYLRTPQGKVAELRLELNSGGKKDKNFSAKKTALKKIVANMTMSNNDMVALFPDIVGCMHIPSLEIKKMYVCRAYTSKGRPLTAPGAFCIWSTMPG